MKKVYLIGFRGTGFQIEKYASEPALIRAGHVGIAFAEDVGNIFGFHPSPEAVKHAGGEEILLQGLKNGAAFAGTLQADRAIFDRAAQLAEQGARTTVWQIVIELSDEEFERVQQQALQWYTEKTTFTYAFPLRSEEPPVEQDNCATFPRRLGLSLPEASGRLVKFIAVLESIGERWKPEER